MLAAAGRREARPGARLVSFGPAAAPLASSLSSQSACTSMVLARLGAALCGAAPFGAVDDGGWGSGAVGHFDFATGCGSGAVGRFDLGTALSATSSHEVSTSMVLWRGMCGLRELGGLIDATPDCSRRRAFPCRGQ